MDEIVNCMMMFCQHPANEAGMKQGLKFYNEFLQGSIKTFKGALQEGDPGSSEGHYKPTVEYVE